jgi:hypothetical protein
MTWGKTPMSFFFTHRQRPLPMQKYFLGYLKMAGEKNHERWMIKRVSKKNDRAEQKKPFSV